MDKKLENDKEVKVTGGKIDKDVLDAMKDADILKSISDEVQLKRIVLNFFCELLSEVKDLRKSFEEFNQIISVCSTDKITSFFKELNKNVKDEEKRLKVYKKVKQSHKKPKNDK